MIKWRRTQTHSLSLPQGQPLTRREHPTFGNEELAVVLSHYDLGVIESITPVDRGSTQSPKVGIVSEKGKFVLKKRAAPRNSLRRVTFTHAIQESLKPTGFPLPHLIPNRTDGGTITAIGSDIYELFTFVSGHPFGHEPAQAKDAGRILSIFHKILTDFQLPDNPPTTTYHDVVGVRTSLNNVPTALSSHDSAVGQQAELLGLIQRLYSEYESAGESANDFGYESLPPLIIHADWHPGNLLFKRDRVVAVIDYDACRLAPRIIDVANGALQFSMTTAPEAEHWPEHVDAQSLTAFIEGYTEYTALSSLEMKTIPHLMIEAIIAETAHPIAQTGAFGTWSGYRCLRMVAKKVVWMVEHANAISESIANAAKSGEILRQQHLEEQNAKKSSTRPK